MKDLKKYSKKYLKKNSNELLILAMAPVLPIQAATYEVDSIQEISIIDSIFDNNTTSISTMTSNDQFILSADLTVIQDSVNNVTVNVPLTITTGNKLIVTYAQDGLNTTIYIEGTIDGAGQLKIDGSGFTELSGLNTFTGGVIVSNGSLKINQSESIGLGVLVLDGGSFDVAGHNLSNNISATGNASLKNTGSNIILSGELTGNGTILQDGDITFDLLSNTHSGEYNVHSGTLVISNSDSLSSAAALKVSNTGSVNFGSYDAVLQSLSGNGSLSNIGHLEVNQSIDTTYSGIISGDGSFEKKGVGKLILTGSNTYVGNTVISAGTLVLDESSLHGNIENNATLEFNLSTTNKSYSDILSGTGVFKKYGSKNLTLGAASSFSGDFYVNEGQVFLNHNNALGIGRAVLNGGLLDLNGYNFSNNLAIESASTLQNSGESVVISGQLSGNSILTLGSGNITFTPPSGHTFTGSIILNSGTLLKAGNSNGLSFGTGASLSVEDGAILDLNGSDFGAGFTLKGVLKNTDSDHNILINSDIFLSGSNAQIDTGSAQTSISGVIKGSQFKKEGAGTLLLSGVNTFTDGIIVNAGILKLGHADAVGLGTLELAGTILDINGKSPNNDILISSAAQIKNTNTAAAINGVISGSGALSITQGDITFNGDSSLYSQTITVGSGITIRAGHNNAFGTGNLVLNGGLLDVKIADIASNLNVTANSTITGNEGSLQGSLSGSGSLGLSTGVFRLNPSSNTYTGTITVSGGKLIIGNSAAVSFGVNGSLTATNSGQIDFNNIDTTITNPYSSGNFSNIGILTINSTSYSDQSGIISGSGSILKTNASTARLSGNNTFSGGVSINQGTLRIGHINALGSGSVSLNGGTLDLEGLSPTNSILITAGTGYITSSSGTPTLSQSFTGSNDLYFSGGDITLSGDSSAMTGKMYLNAGTTRVGSSTALTGGEVHLGGGVLDLKGQTIGGTFSINSTSYITNSQSGQITFTPEMKGAAYWIQSSGDIFWQPTSTSTFTGNLRVQGGKLILGNDKVRAFNLELTNSGTIDGNNNPVTLTFLQGSGSIINTTSLTVNQSNDDTYSGVLSGNTLTLTKGGARNLYLTGANTYGGGTNVTQGNLLAYDSAIQGDFNISSGATLYFVVNNSSGKNYSAIISGAGNFRKKGQYDLTLSNSNTYTGNTYIEEGTLILGSDSSISTPIILSGGSLNFNGLTLSNTISSNSNGSIKNSSGSQATFNGTLTDSQNKTITHSSGDLLFSPSSASNFKGVLLVTNGNLTLSSNQTAGTFHSLGSFGLNGSGSIDLNGVAATFSQIAGSGNISNIGALKASISSNYTHTGIISGSGRLTKEANGTLTLSGLNTYSGGTTITAGTLVLNDNSLQGDIINNATLSLTLANSKNYTGVISSSTSPKTGVVNKNGVGNLTLSSPNTYASGTTINQGTLTAGHVSAFGTGTVSINNAILDLNGYSIANNISSNNASSVFKNSSSTAVTLTGNLSGSYAIAVNGGDITLSPSSNNSSYNSTLTVSEGTLRAGNSHAFSFGANAAFNIQSAGSLDLNGNNLAVSTTLAGTLLNTSSSSDVLISKGITLSGTSGVIDTGAKKTTISQVISGSNASFTKRGTGDLELGALNTYTGGTTVEEGGIILGHVSGLGTGLVTLSTGSTVNQTVIDFAGFSPNLNIAVGPKAGLKNSSSSVSSPSITFTGTDSVNVNSGQISLGLANSSFSGGFNINSSATLKAGATKAFGTGSIVLDGGTLDYAGASAVNNNLIINSSSVIKNSSGTSIVTTGAISGSANLNLTAGQITLMPSGANSNYTGILSVSGTGTLVLGNLNAVSFDASGSLSVNSGGTIDLNGYNLATPVALAGTLSNNSSTSVSITNTLTLSGAPVINTGSQQMTVTSSIEGTSFTKNGTGTLILSNQNNHTAGITLNAGIVKLNHANASGAGTFTFTGGTLDLNGYNISNTMTFSSSSTLKNTAETASTVSSGLNGTSDITISSGSLIFDHSNLSFSRTITVQSGADIKANATTAFGTGTIYLAGGSIDYNSSSSINNNLNIQSTSSIKNTGSSITTTGALYGSAGLSLTQGTISFANSSAHSYTGSFTVLSGATINSGSTTGLSFGVGAHIISNSGSTIELNGYNSSVELTLGGTLSNNHTTNSSIFSGNIILDSSTSIIHADQKDLTLTGVISGIGSSFTKTGDGVLIISGVNTFSGGIVGNSGTLKLGNNQGFGTGAVSLSGSSLDSAGYSFSNNLNLNAATTLKNSTNTASTLSGSIAGNYSLTISTGEFYFSGNNSSYTQDVTLNNGSIIHLTHANGLGQGSFLLNGGLLDVVGKTVSNNLVINADAILKNTSATQAILTGSLSGNHDLTLNQGSILLNPLSNSLTGKLKVTAGTLTAGSDTFNFGSGGSLEVSSTGAVNFSSYGATITSLSGTGDLTNIGNLTLNIETDNIHSGNITGEGSLIKEGTGSLTISGTHTYTGGLIVNNGDLILSANGLQGLIETNSNLIANIQTAKTHNQVISGSGLLKKQGTETLTLSAANTYAGGTVIQAGQITAGHLHSLSSGAITLSGGSLNYAGYALENNLNITTSSSLKNTGSQVELTSELSGAGDLNISSGSWILNPSADNSSYTGSLILENGVSLKAGNGHALAFGTGARLKLETGSSLDFDGASFDKDIQLAGTILNTHITDGSVLSGVIDLTDTSSINTGSSFIRVTGNINGAHSLNKIGSGELILTGLNTYSGGVTVQTGTLSVFDSAMQGNIHNAGKLNVTISNQNITYNDIISGSGNIEKLGSKSLTLTQAQTFTGDIKLSEGTIVADNIDAFGNGNIVLNGGVLDFNGFSVQNEFIIENNSFFTNTGDGVTLTQQLSSPFNLNIKEGIITFAPTSSNQNYEGIITVENGADLIAGTQYAFDFSNQASFIVDHGGVLDFKGQNTSIDINLSGALYNSSLTNNSSYSGNLSLGGNLAVIDVANKDLIISTNIQGTKLTKEGDGRLLLRGSNTYNQGTLINNGSVQLNEQSLQGNIELNSTGTLDILLESSDKSYSNVITGSGTLIKTGSHNLILMNEQTYTGTTYITEGTITYGVANALSPETEIVISSGAALNFNGFVGSVGSIIGYGDIVLGNGSFTLSVDSGQTANYDGTITGSGAVVKTGVGTEVLLGANTYIGGTIIESGTLELNEAALQGEIENNASLVLNINHSDKVYDGIISGPGEVVKTGSKKLTLTQENTFTGDIVVDQGELYLAVQDAILESSSLVIENEGVLNLGSEDLTIASLTGSGTIHLNDKNLTLNLSNNETYDGWIDGSGSLIKTGSGKLTFSGQNRYTGTTLIAEGILELQENSLLKDFENNSHLEININHIDTEYEGNISGTGDLVKTGAHELIVWGNLSYTGATTISQGRLVLTESSLPGDIINNDELKLNINNSDIDFNYIISGTGSVKKIGDKNIKFTQVQTFSGDLLIEEGSVTLDSQNALNSNVSVTLLNNTSLNLNNNNLEIQHLRGSGDVALGAGVLTVGADNIDIVYDGVISGTGSFIKTGLGSLKMNGVNTYTGPTHLNGGSIIIGVDNALSETALMTETNTFLDMNDYNLTLGSLAGEGEINLATGILTFGTNNSSTTYDGYLYGEGSLIKKGTGTTTLTGHIMHTGGTRIEEGDLILDEYSLQGDFEIDGRLIANIDRNQMEFSGNIVNYAGHGIFEKTGADTLTLKGINTYSGNTIITEGVLKLTDSGLSENSAEIINNSVLESMISGSKTYAHTISGTGSFIKSGAGDLSLTGLSTYEGTTTVQEGTLILNNNSFNSNNTNPFVVDGLLKFNIDTTVDSTNGIDLEVTQSISGLGSFEKTGSGGVKLSGVNTYIGHTTITSGLLEVTGDSLAGDVTNDGELKINLTNESIDFYSRISGTGDLHKYGEEALSLYGVTNYSGNTFIHSGSLTLNENSIGMSGNIDIESTATLNINLEYADQQFDGSISGTGTINKTGLKKFNINSAAGFAGEMIVSEGSVQANADYVLSNTVVTIQSDAALYLNDSSNRLKNLEGSGNIYFGETGRSNLYIGYDNQTKTFSGNMYEKGSLIKEGNGVLNLDGSINLLALTVDSGVVEHRSGGSVALYNEGVYSVSGGAQAIIQSSLKLAGQTHIINSSSAQEYITMDGAQLSIYSRDALTATLNGTGGLTLTQQGMQTPIYYGQKIILDLPVIGAGGLNKTGYGSLEFKKNVSYQGDTSIQSGTVSFNELFDSTGSIALNNFATIDFNISADQSLSINNEIAGQGYLNKRGSGSLELTGNNNYSADTILEQGTLILKGITKIGPQAYISTASSTNLYLEGTIKPQGVSFNIKGAGSLYLKGASIVSDDIDGPFLSIGQNSGTERFFNLQENLQNVSGAQTDLGGLTIDTNLPSILYYTLSGNGRFIKAGSGLLNLQKVSSNYTGPVTITEGSIYVNNNFNATSMIDIQSDSSFIINTSTSSSKVFNNSVKGDGSFSKSGLGQLLMTGNDLSEFTGDMIIKSGVLRLKNTQMSNVNLVTIKPYATLDAILSGNSNSTMNIKNVKLNSKGTLRAIVQQLDNGDTQLRQLNIEELGVEKGSKLVIQFNPSSAGVTNSSSPDAPIQIKNLQMQNATPQDRFELYVKPSTHSQTPIDGKIYPIITIDSSSDYRLDDLISKMKFIKGVLYNSDFVIDGDNYQDSAIRYGNMYGYLRTLYMKVSSNINYARTLLSNPLTVQFASLGGALDSMLFKENASLVNVLTWIDGSISYQELADKMSMLTPVGQQYSAESLFSQGRLMDYVGMKQFGRTQLQQSLISQMKHMGLADDRRAQASLSMSTFDRLNARASKGGQLTTGWVDQSFQQQRSADGVCEQQTRLNVVGMKHEVAPGVVMGVQGTHAHTTYNMLNQRGSGDVTSHYAQAFSSIQSDRQWFVGVQAGAGFHRVDGDRQIMIQDQYDQELNYTASSLRYAAESKVHAEAGKSIDVEGMRISTKVTTDLGMQANPGYEEAGAQDLNLKVMSKFGMKALAGLGVDLSRVHTTSFGWTAFNVGVGYEHQFKAMNSNLSYKFASYEGMIKSEGQEFVEGGFNVQMALQVGSYQGLIVNALAQRSFAQQQYQGRLEFGYQF